MNKIYLIILTSALILGAYFYGANITNIRCREQIAQNNFNQIQQTEKNKKEIHDKVIKTGVADIRRILRDKYTIKE